MNASDLTPHTPPPPSGARWRTAILLLLLLTAGAALRLTIIRHRGRKAEPDERAYFQQSLAIRDFFKAGTKEPYIYFLHHARVAGKAIFHRWNVKIARIFVCALGLGTLLLILLAHTVRDRWREAVGVALLAGFSPFLVRYDTSLYAYTFPLLFVTVCCFSYLVSTRALLPDAPPDRQSPMLPAVFVAGLALGIAFMAHNTAVLLLAPFCITEIAVWLRHRPGIVRALYRAGFFGFGLLLCPLWMALLAEIAGYDHKGGNVLGGQTQLSGLALVFNTMRMTQIEASHYASNPLALTKHLFVHEGVHLVLLAAVGCALAIRSLWKERDSFAEGFLLTVWLLLALLVWNFPQYQFTARHTSVLILPLLLLGAKGFAGAEARIGQWFAKRSATAALAGTWGFRLLILGITLAYCLTLNFGGQAENIETRF